ncbi:hypothetical protein OROGR_002999 [Orobanche gracilis]
MAKHMRLTVVTPMDAAGFTSDEYYSRQRVLKVLKAATMVYHYLDFKRAHGIEYLHQIVFLKQHDPSTTTPRLY